MKFNSNIELNANASSEIRNVYIERLTTTAENEAAASLTAAHIGRVIFNVTDKVLKYWSGTSFVNVGGGADVSAIQAELDALELSLGNFIDTDGTFTSAALNALLTIDVADATSLVDVLVKLDQAITAVDVSDQLVPIQTEIDAIETGAGLETDGTYAPVETATYIAEATSLKDADTKLDVAVKALADLQATDKASLESEIDAVQTVVDGFQTEINAIETGAGLETNGAYAPNVTATYVADATSLKDADNKLDAALKLTSDSLATLATVVDGKQATLGFTPINKAGDTVNGNLAFGGTSTIKNLAAPVETGDAVRKIDLDNAVAGITRDFQPDILGFEADFVDQPGRYIYVDGSKFTAGLTPAPNDVVVVDEDGTIVLIAYDVAVQGPGALAWYSIGKKWLQWTGTGWGDFGGMDGVNAGVGLTKDGNTLNVLLGAGIADLPTGEVGIDIALNSGLWMIDDVGAASTDSDAQLALKIESDKGIAVTSAGLKLQDGGVKAVNINADVVGNGLQGGAGTALSIKPKAGGLVVVTADGIDVNTATLDASYLKTSGGTLTGDLVLAADANAPLEATTLQQMQAADQDNADALATAVTGINSKITQVVNSLNKVHYVHDYTTTGATAAIAVVHNLGSKYCAVTVVDADDEVIIPQSVKYIDVNNLEVTLNTDITGKVIVVGHAQLTLV